jgi:HNH endonuclease
VDCERHKRRGWERRPRRTGSYGAVYHHNRKILLRRAGCRPRTGLGGACEICGEPGVPGDPLQADHIVSVADGGGDGLENLRAINRSEHRRRSGRQERTPLSGAGKRSEP